MDKYQKYRLCIGQEMAESLKRFSCPCPHDRGLACQLNTCLHLQLDHHSHHRPFNTVQNLLPPETARMCRDLPCWCKSEAITVVWNHRNTTNLLSVLYCFTGMQAMLLVYSCTAPPGYTSSQGGTDVTIIKISVPFDSKHFINVNKNKPWAIKANYRWDHLTSKMQLPLPCKIAANGSQQHYNTIQRQEKNWLSGHIQELAFNICSYENYFWQYFRY